jgi:hypothetical protein
MPTQNAIYADQVRLSGNDFPMPKARCFDAKCRANAYEAVKDIFCHRLAGDHATSAPLEIRSLCPALPNIICPTCDSAISSGATCFLGGMVGLPHKKRAGKTGAFNLLVVCPATRAGAVQTKK